MRSSPHANNKKNKNDIYVLGKDFAKGINDATIYAERVYSINFTGSNKTICLSLHYNGGNSYLFVNCTEILNQSKRF